MINFINFSKEQPLRVLKQHYENALLNKQILPEAMAISSYDKNKGEVDSRFVNLKIIDNSNFIFFSNYGSPKAKQFDSHQQVSTLLFWQTINIQIRMKAKIKKTSSEYNQKYFLDRSNEKNALAISSTQSKIIDSFDMVQENFKKSLKNDDLKECPKYWGGYSFSPYEIEFWEGNEFRLNKRSLYRKDNTTWNHFILEP
jgi:pyridoxamine 5'-phosphate oxidase